MKRLYFYKQNKHTYITEKPFTEQQLTDLQATFHHWTEYTDHELETHFTGFGNGFYRWKVSV